MKLTNKHLREQLFETLSQLRKKEITPEYASAAAKVSAAILSSAKLDLMAYDSFSSAVDVFDIVPKEPTIGGPLPAGRLNG